MKGEKRQKNGWAAAAEEEEEEEEEDSGREERARLKKQVAHYHAKEQLWNGERTSLQKELATAREHIHQLQEALKASNEISLALQRKLRLVTGQAYQKLDALRHIVEAEVYTTQQHPLPDGKACPLLMALCLNVHHSSLTQIIGK